MARTSVTSRRVWAVLVGTPVALELWAWLTDHPEWTLSPHARWFLRCDTPGGRVFTKFATGAGATVLAHHLITIPPSPADVGEGHT